MTNNTYEVRIARRTASAEFLVPIAKLCLIIAAAWLSRLAGGGLLFDLFFLALAIAAIMTFTVVYKGKLGNVIVMSPDELKTYVEAGCPESYSIKREG